MVSAAIRKGQGRTGRSFYYGFTTSADGSATLGFYYGFYTLATWGFYFGFTTFADTTLGFYCGFYTLGTLGFYYGFTTFVDNTLGFYYGFTKFADVSTTFVDATFFPDGRERVFASGFEQKFCIRPEPWLRRFCRQVYQW